MNWASRYLPPNPAYWQGRANLPPNAYFFQHVRLLNLLTQQPEKRAPLAFAILGFGTDGSDVIRQHLSSLPLQKGNIDCYDAGNITSTDHDSEQSQQALAHVTSLLLTQHITPIIIGGGHELAFGHYQGIANTYNPQKRLGILNFDAHFGLHPLQPSDKGSASTAFYQIAMAHNQEKRHLDYNCVGIQHTGNIRQFFDLANQFNTKIILADELHQGLQEKSFDFIDRIIDENDIIYMSLSLDVFSAAFSPGVSSIQPLGLTPWHVIPLIRQIAASAKMISYDIAELVPQYDLDHRTAKLAAMLIYEIIHHHREHTHLR